MKKCNLILILIITISFQNLISQETTYAQNIWYAKQFTKADSFVLEGLPRDAVPIYDLIFERSKQERNYVMQLKVINDRMVNSCYYEENVLFKVIEQLRDDIKNLEFPVNQVAHSILGNLYWQYYQQNRWRIHQRTTLSGDAGNDIETWDLKRIVQEVINEFNVSLKNPDSLYNTAVDILDQMLIGNEEDRFCRPTLLDLLAHRAINIYKNSELGLISPVDAFTIYDSEYFGSAKNFSNYATPASDSTSLIYGAVKLYKQLTQYHLKDTAKTALIDLELHRLRFIHDQSTHPLKDTLYRHALLKLSEATTNTGLKLEVLYRLANFVYSLESGGSTNYAQQALHICSEVKKDYPDNEWSEYFNSLVEKINELAISLKAERLISSNKPSLLMLSYKNIDSAYFKLYKVNSNWVEQGNNDGFNNAYIDTYKEKEIFKEWVQPLPRLGDYREHKVELPVAALEKGFYVLLVSDQKELNKHSNIKATIINVTDLNLLSRGSHGRETIFSVTNRSIGIPIEGVRLEFFDSKYDYNTRKNYLQFNVVIVTNSQGTASYKGEEYSFTLIASYKGDTLCIPHAYRHGYYSRNTNYQNTVLFTDREIYRPGQTVHFKGLILECSGDTCRILPNRNTYVELRDPNSQNLSDLDVKSNEFGTFSGSFTIPTGLLLLNGIFTLRCSNGTQQIKVEEYKRPTFEINYEPVLKTYNFNDSVHIEGSAKAYAGYPIDNAKISYRINRKVESRWSWYWMGHGAEEKQVDIGNTLTDSAGNFSISYFTDDSDIKDKDQIIVYNLIVDITDANGETQSAEHTLRISSTPLLIITEIPDVIFAQSSPKIKVETNNINGGRVNAKVSIEIVRLEAPKFLVFDRAWEVPDVFSIDEKSFRNDFPSRVYKTETNPNTWPDGGIVYTEKFNTSVKNSHIHKELVGLEQGYYKVIINAKDSSNQEASWEKVVQLIQSTPQMPICAKDWVTPVRTSGEPGEIAEFWLASLTSKTPIFYELLHGDNIVETRTIYAGKKVEKIQIPIEEKYRGGFAVQFVQVAQGQSFISMHEVKVPYTNKRLDISFSTFRDKLLPGEQEQWTLSIKNNLGEKESAEMLATLYDASLDAFAPLNWESNFLRYKAHYQHKWNGQLIARVSSERSLSRKYFNILGWTRDYEYLRLSYSYYGGYNRHYRDLQNRIKERKFASKKKSETNDSLLKLMEEGKAELIGKTGTITGTVTSGSDNEALPGAVIMVYNTNTGAASDLDGHFTLGNLPKGIWLEISYVGYRTQYYQVLTETVTIVMEEDYQSLEDIVIIGYGTQKKMEVTGSVSMAASAESSITSEVFFSADNVATNNSSDSDNSIEQIETRKNFNETAFFYPHLLTDDQGDVTINFTVPEALTRWKMMGFAHTKDFKTGSISNTLITQKDVAIMVNAPRFLRENDTLEFAAKINNLSEDDITGHALIQLFDAISGRSIDSVLLQSEAKVPFTIVKGQSTGVRWKLVIPSGIQAVNYKVMAKAGQHTDGEENILPVLVNSMLVTESLPFMLRPNETAEYSFGKMLDQKSTTLRNEAYTIEFTSNPAWYAIQAMPYLMEYPYECSEQVFSRFFANSLSTTIVNSSPRIKEVFETWKATDSESLISNLEKNQELKELLIQETPWLRNASSETERKKRLGLLFDLNHMSNNINSALLKLQNKQTPNGGFSWFDGMPDNRYITQHIVTGLAQLQHLGAIQSDNKRTVDGMIRRAIKYLDARIIEDYNNLLEAERKDNIDLRDDHISMIQIHYLYCKSFFAPVKPDEKLKNAYDYFYDQARTYWLVKGEYAQGMISLTLNRSDDINVAAKIIKSLANRAIHSKSLGMYWKNNSYGYYWYQATVETQSMLIEAFHEVTADTALIEEMKIWLLRNKQTTDWKTTRATVAACYALILRGTDLISNTELLDVEIGGQSLENLKHISADAGTGYVKTRFTRKEIQVEMGELKVHNPNTGIAWGAAYWQYFENLDKITTAETDLKIVKKLFVKEHTNAGAMLKEIKSDCSIKVGDEVVVRVEIRADRDYEYVHLKDMRASGFEPISTVSEYKYRDGLGYYESVKDASENFFIGYMRKGVYVFEYSLRAVHAGFFSNGITTMQCMYAPEFSSHSEGIRVEIIKE